MTTPPVPVSVPALAGISSMATRGLLAALAPACEASTGVRMTIASVGGVDAARRVAAGEAFDLVFLASDALDKLAAAGHLVAGSRVDLALSGVSVAVPAGSPHPNLSTEASVRAAVLAAPSIGYSTGPSGTALLKRLEAWGLDEVLKGRLIQAPPGVPVATMVARGEVSLGFQQLSELIGQPGIEVVGPLPEPLRIDTVFSGAIGAACKRPDDARRALNYLAGDATASTKRRHGMQPA